MSEMSKASTTLRWKAEITFEGTVENFNAFKASLEKLPIAVSIGEHVLPPMHRAGYIPAGLLAGFRAGQLEKLIEGAPRMQFRSIKDIAGGIRTPHLHLGDEVVLVDKERFKAILGEVAKDIFEHRVENEDDYYSMIMPLAEA
jgi:hypothetical protein